MFGTLFNQKRDPNDPNQPTDSSQLTPQDASQAPSTSQDLSQRQVPQGDMTEPQNQQAESGDSSQMQPGIQQPDQAPAGAGSDHPNPAIHADMSALSHLDLSFD